jgi:gamma-glutamyl:cysteine ligase YbdK (ATP-grasp superfamily)
MKNKTEAKKATGGVVLEYRMADSPNADQLQREGAIMERCKMNLGGKLKKKNMDETTKLVNDFFLLGLEIGLLHNKIGKETRQAVRDIVMEYLAGDATSVAKATVLLEKGSK